MTSDQKPTASGSDRWTITLPVFEFDRPGPSMRLRSLRFPPRWITLLKKAWHRRGKPDGWNLPTSSLIEMLSSLDTHILSISRNIHDPRWLRAYREVDAVVIHIAVASWASNTVTPNSPDIDWEQELDPGLLEWEDEQCTLAEWNTHSNGTAKIAAHTYQLLPAFLAGEVVDRGLQLYGVDRKFVLGPLDPGGPRSAVSWPPERMPGTATDDAWWSYEITFRVRTVPGHPVPRVHAALSTVRFAYEPVVYVPGKPKRATLWMHATAGMLRSVERPTLLAATAGRRAVAGEWAWRWDSNLAVALANLTTRAMPDPHAVITDPRSFHPDRVGEEIAALVVYRNGMKLAMPTVEHAGDQDRPKRLRHEVGTGFQPIDHVEVHEELRQLFKASGLTGVDAIERRTSSAVGRSLPRTPKPDQRYHLELWLQPGDTQDAVLAVLGHPDGVGLQAETTAHEGDLSFTGTFSLSVSLHSIGGLADGIVAKPESDDDPANTPAIAHAIDERIGDIIEALPVPPERVAALVEIDKPATFLAQGRVDPYKAVKLGFLRSGRMPQCLHPVRKQPDPEPQADPVEGEARNKREKAHKRLSGTPYLSGDANRIKMAVEDSLRQLGRHVVLPNPPGVEGSFEIIGVWLEHHQGRRIPITMSVDASSDIRARLIDVGGLSCSELPAALDQGYGRLDKDQAAGDRQLADFVRRALALDATHDRLVFVRAAGIRTHGWQWLQDQHITRDRLLVPGARLDEPRLTPSDAPGLRVVRLREHDNDDEIPRAFVPYTTIGDDGIQVRKTSRASGVFPLSDWVFYGIAPRSAQAQTPLSVSKLDPSRPKNAGKAGYNTNPLEIVTAFLQPSDDSLDWAAYTQSLRRAHLHTDIATVFPVPLHQALLASEYLM